MLILEGFQAGLAWITVLRKREAFRKAFKGFDPVKVARFGEKDVERLMGNAGIIRSGKNRRDDSRRSDLLRDGIPGRELCRLLLVFHRRQGAER
jgi:hypothetical protein